MPSRSLLVLLVLEFGLLLCELFAGLRFLKQFFNLIFLYNRKSSEEFFDIWNVTKNWPWIGITTGLKWFTVVIIVVSTGIRDHTIFPKKRSIKFLRTSSCFRCYQSKKMSYEHFGVIPGCIHSRSRHSQVDFWSSLTRRWNSVPSCSCHMCASFHMCRNCNKNRGSADFWKSNHVHLIQPPPLKKLQTQTKMVDRIILVQDILLNFTILL